MSLKTLQSLLNLSAPVTGQITEVTDDGYRVRTSRGIVKAIATTTGLKPGDTVSLQGGVITGRLTDPSTLPVYFV